MGVNGIYGLSGSGMDIESMVKVGMMSKQSEYDKMAQKYTKNEWTKSAYLELNNSINTFNLSTLSQYKLSSSMNAKSAESNSSAVKVDANASAGVMPHKVAVEDLSTNAYLISTKKIKRVNSESTSTSLNLKDILFKNLAEETIGTGTYDSDGKEIMEGTGKVKGTFVGGNGTTYTFSSDNYDNKELTNQKGPAAALTDTAIRFFIGDGTKDDDGNLKTVEISYTYNEVLNGNVTINDLVSKINIKASFDTVNEKFSIYNSKGGKDNTIYLAAGDNSFTKNGTYADDTTYTTTTSNFAGSVATTLLHGLGLQLSANGSLSGTSLEFQNRLAANTVTGTDGKIIVDGVEYTTTDNKVTAGGITYTALDTTKDSTGAVQMATVTVSQDVDAIVDKVKSFVADYNKLLASLYEKYDEKPDSNYKPLTQSQKDAMKEEQITKWEEKAKKGLLYHDQTIGKIITEMRDAISSPVDSIEGKYNSAYSIGISTTGLKGQLVLDEDKLRKALNDDADSVYNVFAKIDTSKKDSSGNVIDNPDGNGIAQRLGDVFTAATKAIKSRAGSSESITEDSDLNTLLRQLQTKMSNFKKMMASFEDKLYKKYDTMETTLAKLGAQLSFISGGQ